MAELRIRFPRLPCGALGLSLALHLGLLFLIGGWIITSPATDKVAPEAFAGTGPALQDEWNEPLPEPETFEPDLTDSAEPTPPPPSSLPAGSGAKGESFSTFVTSAPATLGVAGNLLPETPVSGGANHAADGRGTSRGLPDKIRVGNLFDTRVESARLGVLLDVSSSAHAYLPLVVGEVERNFKDTVIVLTYGCGLYEKAAADQMYLKEFNRCKPDRAGAKNTLGQIAKAAAANGETGNLMKQFRIRKDTYVLYAEDCGHTHYGFKKLLAERVDTIYWFADFRDKISNRVANQLIRELKQNGIKVIAHNFSGKPVPEEGEKIATETGGTTIAKIPGGHFARTVAD